MVRRGIGVDQPLCVSINRNSSLTRNSVVILHCETGLLHSPLQLSWNLIGGCMVIGRRTTFQLNLDCS